MSKNLTERYRSNMVSKRVTTHVRPRKSLKSPLCSIQRGGDACSYSGKYGVLCKAPVKCDKFTKSELIKIAAACGIEVADDMTKQEICDAIKGAERR
jgi:hypothetical protein